MNDANSSGLGITWVPRGSPHSEDSAATEWPFPRASCP